MDRIRSNTRLWLVYWIFMIFCVLPSGSDPKDPFESQPKIVAQNGNIIIKSAANRNVTLKAFGLGSIQVNDIDLLVTMPLIKTLLQEHAQNTETTTNRLSALESQIGVLRNQFSTLSNLAPQISQLEENVTTIFNQMNEAFGGTSHATLMNFRRAIRKVRRIEDKVKELTQLLSTDECLSNPCRNGGTCVDTYNGFLCRCIPSWEGVTCETDVNECAIYTGTSLGCQNGATCQNTPGSFNCQCRPNYFGFHCSERHDDCTSSSHEELCVHGTCVNEERVSPGQPKYRCICDAGWEKSSYGPACTQDINECAIGTHRCSTNPPVICINLPGTFHCGPCPAGYSGDGWSCLDINECLVHNGGCSLNPYVACINTVGSRNCGPCPSGYVGDGVSCTFVGLCSTNNGGCHPLATCVQNTAISGSYRECRCPSGYVGNGEGLVGCTAAVAGSSCASSPCQNGNCQVVGSSFHCTCFPGYTGTLCDQQADPCLNNPCQNGGTCVSHQSTFTCLCNEQFEGEICSVPRQSCGGDIFQDEGNISFPLNSGEHYAHRLDCVWVIAVSYDKVLNFSFPRFHLEEGNPCDYDWVEIHDGPHATSPLMGRFCGAGPELSFLSTHNQIYLWFKSDHSVSATGFTIKWNATDPLCGGELPVSTHGAINSPGYPGNYPQNRDCYWLVRVDLGKRIQFQFATLQLEHHDNCSFDYLRIIDGASESDPELSKYCSTVTPAPVISSGANALLHFHSDFSVSDTGFHITYAAIPGISGCGGLLSSPTGTFQSPNFPDVYAHLLRCEWLIRIHPNDRIELSFSEFQVEYHSNCQFDYVAVYNGETDASNLIGRYCGGTEPPPKIMSNGNKLLIKFHTDYSVAHGGFRASYTTICGGLLTGLEDSFHSPYFPDVYPASATCYYQVNLPPGYLIHLTIPFLDIESHRACAYDFLEVRDGPGEDSTLVQKLCGSTSPEPITSTYNQMWFKFSTDGSIQTRGFYANYTSSAIGCGGVMTNSTGYIGTPSHRTLYPPSVTCTWLLRAPEGFVVRLTFDTFALEDHTKCDYDYVLVQDSGGARIGKYCGFSLPPTLLSTNNEMHVTFVADSSVSHEGFNATYVFVDSSRVCGGDYYIESGVVRSPKYPLNYPNSKDCVWVLHAPNGRQFLLNVSRFELEQHEDCRYDYLEIRNGGYVTSPLIGNYCGQTIPSSIPSHSNTMRLEFHSDSSMSAPGFEIFFDSTATGCGGRVTSPRGNIISPNYPNPYGHSAECTWSITVSQGSAISVSIVDLDVEGHDTCDNDFLQIYDGSSDTAKSLTRLCNGKQIPHSIKSTGNTVFIKFRTDVSDSGRGFHLTYSGVCTNVLKKQRGVIESPNFPNTYPHNHNCTWTIEAPVGNNISLSFSYLVVENTSSCDADYVEVELPADITPVPRTRYCGSPFPLPLPTESTTNLAIVRLITDSSVSREGFRLEYAVKGCGGDLTKNYGVITSPNYPNGYSAKVACQWHIKYPPGNRVKLQVSELDLEGAEECIYDYLKVFAGEDETAPQLLNLCHKINNETIVYSHGNHMFIKFYSDGIIGGKGFKAFYRKENTGCGGFIKAEHSVVMSPGYPSRYNANDDCQWIIQVDPNHIVELIFSDFEMPTSINCSLSYVAVYDGANSSTPLIMQHCGGMPQNSTLYSTGNSMTIRLKADGNNVAKGFRAQYNTGCGQRILADNGGEITSPNYPHGLLSITNCSWILYASEPTDRITLVITNLNFVDSEDCRSSSLEIRDGDQADSPLNLRICGRDIPPHMTSQGNAMHIFLHFRGVFRATYLASTSHCGGSYTSVSGSFASPEYPNNYPIDTECVWILSASAGNKIIVSFSMFNMEDSDFCNMDYVEVREDNEAGHMIGRYCGNQIPSNITAANKLWIKFRSDPIGASPGFLAHYGVVHNSEINGTSGIIESPDYPHPYVGEDTFQWTITVPSHLYVSVSFEAINIPYVEENRCWNSVKVYDGATTEAPELDEFCGYQPPDPVVSHGSQMTIVFDGRSYSGSWWRLRWNAVDETSAVFEPESSCWNETYVNASHSIELLSPNYPNYYPYGYNCSWIIHAPPGNRILLNFTDFNVYGYTGYCSYYDKVEIYTLPSTYVDSWTLNTTLCGRLGTAFVLSPNQVLKMTLITGYYYSSTGFNATASTMCGGPLEGGSGTLNSSYFLVAYLQRPNTLNFSCDWIITVRPRRTIRITFDSFNIPSDNTCSGRYLKLLNGAHRSSPHLGNGKYCGSSVPPALETSSNHAFINLNLNNLRSATPRFVLRYEELSTACGGNVVIDSDRDYDIQTPNYPQAPPHDMVCDWIIMSPQGTRILVVDFYDGDSFRFTGGCFEGNDVEYVQLYDGGTELSEPLARYCGHSSMSRSPITTGNVLLIRFFTSVEHPEVGFKAKVRTAECGGTISSFYEDIKSPNYPENYDNAVECEWLIRMREPYLYYLELKDLDTPPASDCTQTDYIEVRNDDKNGELIGIYCGSPNNSTKYINLPSNNAYIKFKSNTRDNARGFYLDLLVDYSSYCGGELTEPSGVITSPNYPMGSSAAHHCYWRIVAPDWRRITVTFTQVNLEKDEETGRCIDSLEFYSISWRRGRVFEICGNQIPDPIESSGSKLYMKFKNNGWVAGEGFSLSYTTEKETACGSPLPIPSGYVTSPNLTFGSNNWTECHWMLDTAEKNQTATFRFTALDIPGNRSNYCREAVVYFSGGTGRDTMHLSYYCGNMTTRLPTVISSYPQISMHFQASLETPFLGFNVTYNVSDCGGVIDGYNATITSPGYPNNYTANTICQWILTVNYGDTITATITDLRMENNCDRDYVQISDIPYLQVKHGKFCGTRLPEPVTTTYSYMVVTFHTDGYGTAPGFRLTTAEVERGCGGVIHRRRGYISSPNYPGRYPANTECEWTIEYTSGSIVNLTFVGRFDLQMSTNCANDYLLVQDYDEGRWFLKGRYCGPNRPDDMLSTSTKMRITFHSNSDVAADGFQIYYSAGCGGHFTESEGTIRSPEHPDIYPNNLHCQYIIGEPGHIVSFEFTEFDLEAHSSCVYDYITIYRGNSTSDVLEGKYCGSEAPPSLSMSGQVLLVFVTDYTIAGHGFLISYETTDCGGNRTGPYGIIKGPKHGYPNAQYLTCAWNIYAGENRAISLWVLELPENGLNCYNEAVIARDSNSSGGYIGSLCNYNAKSSILKSYSNKMYVRYSNWYGTMTGFVVAYRSTLGPKQGCGGFVRNSTGEFQSPDADNDGKYDHELDCLWAIIGDDSQAINITFSSFNLEGPRNGSCIYDYVEIRDGLYSGDPVIGRYCGSAIPPPIVSSSNRIAVLFHSDSKENRQGFRAAFASVPTQCGELTLYISSYGAGDAINLTSPGYPTSYPANAWCRWRIYPSWEFRRIQIHFTDIDVPCSTDDYIEVRTHYEVDKPYRFCRNTPNLHDILTRGETWVTFRSGSSGNGRGFRLSAKKADCNQNFTKENGVITSPSYPYSYTSHSHCVTTVETTLGRTISLYFGRFVLQKWRSAPDQTCNSASLKVYEGDVNSTLIVELCGSALPNPIFSTGNKLTVELNTTYEMETLYSISYTTTDRGRGCGGTLNHVNGTFTSPLYPEPYNQSSTCIWYLSVPSYHTMTLDFTFFELSSVAGCETNYLELYEGHAEVASNRIYRLCGDDNPGTYNSQGYALMVKLVTNNTNTAPGFVAHFDMNSYVNAQTPDVLHVRQAAEIPYWWYY